MSPRSEPPAGLADALFRPVRTGNSFEETLERLLQAVRLGVVGPGERLPPERELAFRLGVSRVTLREAIRVLVDSGYAQSRRGRYGGTFVGPTLPVPRTDRPAGDLRTELEDTLALRFALETGAAELAANRSLTPASRRHLRSCLEECTGAETADYRRKDSRLHLAVAEATASPSLITAVVDVRSRLNALLAVIPLVVANVGHSDRQHAVIVGAILDGDPDLARSSMAEHLAGTGSLLRGFLA